MLTSILPPVVHGTGPRPARRVWLTLAALHSFGSVLSAVAAGGVLMLLARGMTRVPLRLAPCVSTGVLLVAVLYLPRQMGWTAFPPLLQSTRQVPRRWAYDHPRWATALLFGLGLGSGVYTRIVTPTFYLLLGWPLLMPGSWWSLVIWGTYGLARSGHVWWLAVTARPGDPFPRVSQQTCTLFRWSRRMVQANACVQAATAAWLLAWRALG